MAGRACPSCQKANLNTFDLAGFRIVHTEYREKKMKKEEVLQYFGYHFGVKSPEVDYFPPVIWIEPTSICNLKCGMCPTGKGKVREKSNGVMEKETFKRIVSQMQGRTVIRTALFFRGEPLINQNIVEMVKIAAVAGFNPYFHSNGTLMNRDIAERLIEAGLNYISFSFDGATKSVYEKHRRGGIFEKTLSNIRGFLEAKMESTGNKPHVVIQSIDFDDLGDNSAIQALFVGLPVDQFNLVPLHNWSGEITECKAKGEGQVYPCPDPWQRLTICWDGTVVGCCNDMLQKFVLGNVLEQDIMKIWNGEKMKELRHLMEYGKNVDHPLCKGCQNLYTENWCI